MTRKTLRPWLRRRESSSGSRGSFRTYLSRCATISFLSLPWEGVLREGGGVGLCVGARVWGLEVVEREREKKREKPHLHEGKSAPPDPPTYSVVHPINGGADVVENAVVADKGRVLKDASAVLDNFEARVGVKHVNDLGQQRRLGNVEERVHHKESAGAKVVRVDERGWVALR